MISIRTATGGDIDGMVALINSAFLVEKFFIERDRTNPEIVAALMQKGKFLVAEEDSKLAGCVYVELRGERGYLGMLSVDPGRQRSGVGRKLLAAAERYFVESGCKFSDLKIVNVREDLHAMYLHLGYIETGTAPYDSEYPTKMPVHFIDMSKSLA